MMLVNTRPVLRRRNALGYAQPLRRRTLGCGAGRCTSLRGLGFDWGSLIVGVTSGIAGGFSGSSSKTTQTAGKVIDATGQTVAQAMASANQAQLQAQLAQQQAAAATAAAQQQASSSLLPSSVPPWAIYGVGAIAAGALVIAATK